MSPSQDSTTALVLPGDIISSLDKHQHGKFTYTNQNNIHSSVMGHIHQEKSKKPTEFPFISVQPLISYPILSQGCLVLCQVTQIASFEARCIIISVADQELPSDHGKFLGVLRQQDIRLHEIDKIKIEEMFRVGDIVRARVLSLGDSKRYILSTASNELGVVKAMSRVGAPLVAVDWDKMQCEKTGLIERRKVAAPLEDDDENMDQEEG
mmetsp:Transcript_11388/g.42763  ORF Transcript_11388/g.42763 Transcript_11388/m.42763 type:complete len:209 (+) Transcript_11388:3-629(+)